eukprot:symbB.v1.2.008979.t1/scaffold506.1/size199467/4
MIVTQLGGTSRQRSASCKRPTARCYGASMPRCRRSRRLRLTDPRTSAMMRQLQPAPQRFLARFAPHFISLMMLFPLLRKNRLVCSLLAQMKPTRQFVNRMTYLHYWDCRFT